MANEIDFSGKLVQYGGPTIVLKDVPLGAAVERIYAREATGWKLFTSGASDFLNSKKRLDDGDIVLVVPKVVPMDFPVKPPLQSELIITLEPGIRNAPLTADVASKVGNWVVSVVDGIDNATYAKNGDLFNGLFTGLPITLALGDTMEVEGEVAVMGTVVLIPA